MVPDSALSDAIAWLDANAESEPGGPKFRGTHPGYVQLVLSLAGKPHKGAILDLLDEPVSADGKDREGRAGWEIENPRLGRGHLPDWARSDKVWTLDYLDMRDDRLNAFGMVPRGETRTVTYAVRAVTAGTFAVPAARAEAMYDPEVWGRTGGSWTW